jgi:hypothetical protein
VLDEMGEWFYSKPHAKTDHMVVVPLAISRRSLLAGEAERRCSHIHGAMAMQGTRERTTML